MLHVQQLKTVLGLHEVVQWHCVRLKGVRVFSQVVLWVWVHVDLSLARVGIDLIEGECLLVGVLALGELGTRGTCQNRLLQLLSLAFEHV